MDPKEVGRSVGGSDATGHEQQATAPSISSKALIPTPASSQKCAQSPGPDTPKILSRNCNGTVVWTSSPNNEAELQLYRVMQRASLLAYYDTLLEMGGDDVQQLCDAGEEEFLEIMALVGMASKPLHVRRLQKALQEWMTSPALFQTPLTSTVPAGPSTVPQLNTVRPVNSVPVLTSSVPSLSFPNNHTSPGAKETSPSPSPDQTQAGNTESNQKENPIPGLSLNPGPSSPLQATPVLVESQISRLAEAAEALVKTLPQFEPKPHNTKKKICRDLETVMNMAEDDPRRMDEIRKYAAIYGRFDCKRNPQKPLTLHEVSVNEAAAQICRFSPALLTRRDDLFALARQVVRDSGYQYTKSHAGITSYRVSVPPYQLSTRNTDENPSAKRPKMDAISSLSPSLPDICDLDRIKRQERLEQIAEELRVLGDKTEELVEAAQKVRQTNDLSAIQSLQHQMETVQNKQTQLLLEQSELLKQPLPSRIYRRNHSRLLSSHYDSEKHDTDDTDSQFSLSNTSSPSQEVGDSRDSLLRDGESINSNSSGSTSVKSPGKPNKQYITEILTEEGIRPRKGEFFFQDNKVQVISASGSNIIAVANPALSMSSVFSKNGEISIANQESCLLFCNQELESTKTAQFRLRRHLNGRPALHWNSPASGLRPFTESIAPKHTPSSVLHNMMVAPVQKGILQTEKPNTTTVVRNGYECIFL